MFEATLAGSLPKPSWLAETNKLWPQWRAAGPELASAKRDATVLWLKEQEDAGLAIVSDGEQSRQHFVHGFLEFVEGIDFANKVKMGIRNNRYDAMCRASWRRCAWRPARTRPRRASRAPTPGASSSSPCPGR